MLTTTITIATRNRVRDLAETLEKVAALEPAPLEIIVCADGCTDGTVELVRDKHPAVRLHVNKQPLGSVASRDDMIRSARGDLVLSLDDDSHPVETDFIAHLGRLFTERPRLAVAMFPQRSDEFPESLTATNFGPARVAGSYLNSGAAIRRSAYVEVGGYPRFFFHAYEEPDLALRCLAADWEVLFCPDRTVRHRYTGAQRNELRTHFFHSRNELWSVLLRCPMPFLPAVAAFRIVRQWGYAWHRGWRWVLAEPRWWLASLAGIPSCAKARTPLPWKAYRRWMQLIRNS